MTLLRLVGLVAGRRWSIAVGALLGFAAIGSNIALLATAAYLISKAALVTNVAEVALAITAVRVLAIARAVFRYLERYVTHAATLRILADLRVWFYASIEPIAPARLTSHRSGDLLTRVVADVETLERFYVQVLVPPITAALVVAAASVLAGHVRCPARRRPAGVPRADGDRRAHPRPAAVTRSGGRVHRASCGTLGADRRRGPGPRRPHRARCGGPPSRVGAGDRSGARTPG